jgi:hypothetical protein
MFPEDRIQLPLLFNSLKHHPGFIRKDVVDSESITEMIEILRR